jgi:outer membrane protein TolC
MQGEIEAMEVTTAQADVEAAQARLDQARATLTQLTNEPPTTLAELTSSIQAVEARIAEVGAEKDILEATGTHPTEENMV